MTKTASILVIGNEILSGRVQDRNISFLAKKLSELGVKLVEVRIVLDIKNDIIVAINELRANYDYVFTTGGIGPTHDDITSESISEAFGVEYERNEFAYRMILDMYLERGEELNSAREKMAFMPKGAELISNDITKCPGFKIENVFVMAGIPEIMQNMFSYIENSLERSDPIISHSIKVHAGESIIAEDLEKIQKRHIEIDIGSYPFKFEEKHMTEIVFKGKNEKEIESAKDEFTEIIKTNNIRYDI
jgi:molybdenum cofactor synthesis domain-containing protein